MMIAAQREHEEKKVPFMGTLLANIAFEPDIGRGRANLLIRLAEDLSYQQLCILAIIADYDAVRKSERPIMSDLDEEDLRLGRGFGDATEGTYPSLDHAALYEEVYDLG